MKKKCFAFVMLIVIVFLAACKGKVAENDLSVQPIESSEESYIEDLSSVDTGEEIISDLVSDAGTSSSSGASSKKPAVSSVNQTSSKTASTASTATAQEKRGNTAGNQANCGYVVFDSGWVYYVNLGDNSKLYRMHSDGTGKQKLGEDQVGSINIIDNWVYFCNGTLDGMICRMRTDGTDMQILNHKGSGVSVVGDWIYYLKQENSVFINALCRVSLDGSNMQQLNNDCSSFCVANGWIYYRTVANDHMYRMRSDGTNPVKIVDGECENINIVEDNIYYYDGDRNVRCIYRISVDGSNKKEILSEFSSINISDGWLYCHKQSDGALYRVRLDGTDLQKLNDCTDCTVKTISIADGWIYLCNYSTLEIHRVRLNGTDLQKL